MTLRVAESWDWIPPGSSGAAIDAFLSRQGCYNPAAADVFKITTGRFAGNGLQFSANWGPGAGSVVSPMVQPYAPPGKPAVTITEGRMGGAMYVSSGNGMASAVVAVFDMAGAGLGPNGEQISVEFGQYGIIQVWRGKAIGGTLLATTPAVAYLMDTWFSWEVGYKIDPTVGYVTVKINAGVPTYLTGIVVALTNVNTQATSHNTSDSYALEACNHDSGNRIVIYTVTDFYVDDVAGAQNNDFLGCVRTQYSLTIGPGAVTGLSIGGSSPAATNWQSVQDTALDEAQYVFAPFSGGAGLYDLYAMNPLVNQGPIFGVQTRVAMRQDDATQIEGGVVVKSGATTVDGAPRLLNETYTYIKDIFELDPNTGLAWLYGAVNSLQMGPQRVA